MRIRRPSAQKEGRGAGGGIRCGHHSPPSLYQLRSSSIFATTGQPPSGPHSLLRCASSTSGRFRQVARRRTAKATPRKKAATPCRLCPRTRRRQRRLRWPRARRHLLPRCAAAAIRPGTSIRPYPVTLIPHSQLRPIDPQPQPQPSTHRPKSLRPKFQSTYKAHPLGPRPGGEAPARALPRAADHGERRPRKRRL